MPTAVAHTVEQIAEVFIPPELATEGRKGGAVGTVRGTPDPDIRQWILATDKAGVWPTAEKARKAGLHCASHVFRRIRWEIKANGQLFTNSQTHPRADGDNPHSQDKVRKPQPDPPPKPPWEPLWCALWSEAMRSRLGWEIECVRSYRAAWQRLRRAKG
jgi:hypothetical protein